MEQNVQVVKEEFPEILVIYDDRCNLCRTVLQWVLPKIRTPDRLRFVPQHSDLGQRLLREAGTTRSIEDAMVVLKNGSVYQGSEAVIQMADGLSGGWRMLGYLKWVPRRLRDWGYSVIARNRYRIFGRSNDCSRCL